MQSEINIPFILNAIRKVGLHFLKDFKKKVIPQNMEDLLKRLDEIESTCLTSLKTDLANEFPDTNWHIANEFENKEKRENQYWLCDGMDGVIQYLHHLPGWSINLVLIRDKQPYFSVIFDPLAKEMFWVKKGNGVFMNGLPIHVSKKKNPSVMLVVFESGQQEKSRNNLNEKIGLSVTNLLQNFGTVRNFGPHGLQLAHVGAGRIDLFIQEDIDTFNWIAGILIAEEAGAVILTAEGVPWKWGNTSLLVATKEAAQRFLKSKKTLIISNQIQQMKKQIKFLTVLLFLTVFNLFSQDKVTLSGIVMNNLNNETLIGANISFPEANASITTNSYGFYSITLPKGDYTIIVSYVGFDDFQEKISLIQNTKKNFSIEENGEKLEEVVIISNKTKVDIRKPEMSTNKLSIATIRKMPAIMGEVDILKSILQLPGVTNAQEGASGFNVRGGSVDGNLVLLDEAVVYNTSHLFGFFSVFNSDVIKDLKLYKGGIPANFGGRVSSVLDIYQKEGNNKEFHINGGIGLISSRMLVEGPIVKEKSSFVIAGRSSYVHLFLKLANEPNSVYFYDINTKFNYKINDKNNIFVSGYLGNDIINFNNSFVNTYGNTIANIRWNHIFSDKLFSNASAIYSDYNYGLQLDFIGLDWKSDVKNYNFKYDFKNYISDKLTLNFGINSIYYNFNPGTINPLSGTSTINSDQIAKKFGFENALYISAEQKVSENFSINYGLRFSTFDRLGKQELNTYLNNQAVVFNSELQIYEEANPNGTIKYGTNKRIINFNNLEPRMAMSYSFNNNQSVKASYNRMSQYIHLITNTASATPLDIWAPSDQYLKPEILDQVAIGYFQNFKEDKYSIEVETFYKTIKNKTDYIDGADLIANKAIERVLLNGKARSYGLEIMFKKNTGKLNGWISYTLSKAEQKTPGRTQNELGINDGEWYRANYDKRHNLSVTTAFELNKKWSFGGIFTYQTGKAATFPNGKYKYQAITVANYGLRNQNSLSAYHHLDLSATYIPKPDNKKGWQGEWIFSIYNAYNRSNASAYTFGQNTSSGINEARRTSIFGIIPGITYNFKF